MNNLMYTMFDRIIELEEAIKVKRIDCDILDKANKYNCYMRVINDLDLLQELTYYRKERKCQEEL